MFYTEKTEAQRDWPAQGHRASNEQNRDLVSDSLIPQCVLLTTMPHCFSTYVTLINHHNNTEGEIIILILQIWNLRFGSIMRSHQPNEIGLEPSFVLVQRAHWWFKMWLGPAFPLSMLSYWSHWPWGHLGITKASRLTSSGSQKPHICTVTEVHCTNVFSMYALMLKGWEATD